MEHFLVIAHNGQKFLYPAITGAIPKKNHKLPLTIPAAIKAAPIAIRNGLQKLRKLLKFIRDSLVYFQKLYLL